MPPDKTFPGNPTGLPPCGGHESPGGVSTGGLSTGGVSRRRFLGTTGTAATLAAAGSRAAAAGDGDGDEVTTEPGRETATVSVTLNGEARELSFDARASLLDVLREREGLTGTKKGCDHGSCGACTVHIARPGDDGPTRQLACLTFALTLDGAEVTTIEGLADGGPDGDLHPVQEAFLRCDAYQCGYCTPGQIMSAAGVLDEGHAGSREEVREWMSGNLCRCSAYPNIVAAVRQAAGAEPAEDTATLATIVPADPASPEREG